MLLGATFLRAQLVIPPSVMQRQADQKHTGSDAAAADQRDKTRSERKQIELLKSAALGADGSTVLSAVRELKDLGDPAKPTLREALRTLLGRDRSMLESLRGMPGAPALADASEKLAAERQAAVANIAKLAHDQTLKVAHDHYDSLKSAWESLRPVLGQMDAMARALGRRQELLADYRELVPTDRQYSPEAEARLTERAQKLLGFSAEQLAAIPEGAEGPSPSGPVLRDLWFFRTCRRVAAYNQTLPTGMTPGELENAQLVNGYREYLGIAPYEFDPRLVEAARGHSREMVALHYFDHESPVAANHTPWDRIKAAGYKNGSGENIAMGAGTGKEAFWMWFDSPGHHQNMARAGNTTLGVGNVGVHWTQNMGSGRRLMLASPEERKAELESARK